MASLPCYSRMLAPAPRAKSSYSSQYFQYLTNKLGVDRVNADILDDAIVRAKRIDRKIEIGYPDVAAARRILEIHLRDRLAEDGLVDAILAKTALPISGAALEGKVDLLVARAVRRAKADRDLRLLLKDVP